jgi:NADH:ubiquinone oxidoreductase subunit 5 (subunit L)/multisubunit Na+/H+ antiporter MnhA subunit
MDSLQPVFVFGAVLSPLIAALAIAAAGLVGRSRDRLPARLAQLGAGASALCALGEFLRRELISRGGVNLAIESPLSLGSWYVNGRGDLLRVSFQLRFEGLTALFVVALALTSACLFSFRSARRDAFENRALPIAGSLLLFASIGVAASCNFSELFVFWVIGTAVAYVLSSVTAQNVYEANAARKLVLILSLGDVLLLSAVLALAGGLGPLDFRALFSRPDVWLRAAAQREAVVNLIGLCLLGAYAGRCGMIPFLGWIGDLADRPASLAALIGPIAIWSCGVLLLNRSFPLLHSASAILPLAAFLGGASAFCAGACSIAAHDVRRAVAFACASALGIVLLALTAGASSSTTVALGLMTVLVPGSALLLIVLPAFRHAGDRNWLVVLVAALFSGMFGQAWLLGGVLYSLFAVPGHDAPTLLLGLLLAISGQYLAACSLGRIAGPLTGFSDRPTERVTEPTPPSEPQTPRIVLASAAVLVAALTAVSLLTHFELPQGNRLVCALLGLGPGVCGLVVGMQSARFAQLGRPSEQGDGIVMRLGRRGFYFDTFLFLCVLLPLRGVAGVARFLDWAVVDAVASGGPVSLLESAASFFAPLQRRGVVFYLCSALLGTVVLSGLLIWLRG